MVNTSVNFDVFPEPNYLEDFFVIQSEYDTVSNGINLRRVGDYLFHQDNQEVYYMYNDTLRLIYDFGVEVGDTVHFDLLGYPSPRVVTTNFIVNAIEQVPFDTFNLKKFTLSPEGVAEIDEYVYIERIGSTRVMVEDMLELFSVPGYHSAKTRCYIENNIVYQTDWYNDFGLDNCKATTSTDETDLSLQIEVYPNPFVEKVIIRSAVTVDQIQIHSTDGLHMITVPMKGSEIELDLSVISSGIYIISLFNREGTVVGRKKIIRL